MLEFLMHSFQDETCVKQLKKYQLIKYEPMLDENITFFHNFNEFSSLKLASTCNQKYNVTNSLEFLPNRKLIMDKSFKIKNLIDQVQFNNVRSLIFNNINGIDLNLESFFNQQDKKEFVLFFSKFNIFSNGSIVKDCTPSSYPNISNILSSFSSVYFRQVVYPKQICPLLFRNTQINYFFFTDITNSYLIKNRLIFTKLDINKKTILSHDISLYLEVNYESLTFDIINLNMFKDVQSIQLLGVLNNIDTLLFKKLTKLKIVLLKIINLKEFFHKGNKWLTNLNSHVNVDLTNGTFEIDHKLILIIMILNPINYVSFNRHYVYSNEDICLFKDFPHKHLVMPYIYPGKRVKCSCTLKWIHLYNYKYTDIAASFKHDFYTDFNENEIFTHKSVYVHCADEFKELICDFDSLLKNCLNFTGKDYFSAVFRLDNDVGLLFLIKWTELILLLYLQPILCLISLITNTLVILTIRNRKKKKEFKEKMYTYILINAAFNIIYCLIMLLKLVNTCVFFYAPSACSLIYQTNTSQYFKIIGIFYLGNVFKTCSNISYTFFTLSRLIAVSFENKQHLFYKKFHDINIKFYSFILVLFSSVLSIFILFQYEINFLRDYRKEFPFEKRNEKFCQNLANKSQCRLFNAFKIINQVFNVIVFVVLNLFFDIILLKQFDKNMKKKVHLETSLNRMKDIKKKTKKLTKMVVVNGILYFISHAPEFVSTLLLLIFSKKLLHFCNERISCDIINEEAEFFIIISMISNFFIFKHFNKNFRDSFRQLIR